MKWCGVETRFEVVRKGLITCMVSIPLIHTCVVTQLNTWNIEFRAIPRTFGWDKQLLYEPEQNIQYSIKPTDPPAP